MPIFEPCHFLLSAAHKTRQILSGVFYQFYCLMLSNNAGIILTMTFDDTVIRTVNGISDHEFSYTIRVLIIIETELRIQRKFTGDVALAVR